MKIITHLQLRSARQVLNIKNIELAQLLTLGKSTISQAELGQTRDFFFRHSATLIEFFAKNNIIFPNEFVIRFNTPQKPTAKDQKIITRFQLRSARCLLNLSQLQLAQLIQLHSTRVRRAELLNNTQNILSKDNDPLFRVKDVFLENGIEFFDPYSIFFKKHLDNNKGS